MKFISKFFLLIIVINLWSCDGTQTPNSKVEPYPNDTAESPAIIKIDNKLFALPSPVQIADALKNAQVPYDGTLLNSVENYSNYNTNFKKAVNLGVYGTNMGYINIYEQLQDAGSYFIVIKTLIEDLDVDVILKDKTLKKIEKNLNNKDSIMLMIWDMYKDIDSYLFESERSEVSAMIIAGAWIESQYILTQTIKKNKDEKLYQKLCEQKYPLNNLIDLLKPYYKKQSNELDILILKLVEVAYIFDGIDINYKFHSTQTDTFEKLTIINNESKPVFNDYHLQTITDSIYVIRQFIVE